MVRFLKITSLLALLVAAPGVLGVTVVPPSVWDYPYPWPLHYYSLTSQTQKLSMAYMDVAPTSNSTSPPKTAVLIHGKNFCGVTWEVTARVLTDLNYRVIIPDQIGFCKSSKPTAYQFTLHQLAANTRVLLNTLGVTNATIIGHSMGGMLAARFALMYPDITTRLVLTNPLGLEDWKALGVPYKAIDDLYISELQSNYTSIRAYQQSNYYANTWKPEYDVWVYMQVSVYNMTTGGSNDLSEGALFSFDMASTTEMMLTQPIVYELGLLSMPTLLLIGMKDISAIGSRWAPADVRAKLGHYDVLAGQTAAKIPNSTLVTFADSGHSPQIQEEEAYHQALVGWLEPDSV